MKSRSAVVSVSANHDGSPEVEVYFDRTLGGLEIRVDGETRIRELRVFSLSTKAQWTIKQNGRSNAVITVIKTRNRFFGGLQPQKIEVFIDDDLVASGSV